MLDDLRAKYKAADAAHKRPVRIEAFISPEVPESYLQTRINLLSVLRELESRGGEMLQVQINSTDRYGPEADMARKRYNIEPKQVTDSSQGVYRRDNIYLAVAFTSGLEKVVIPFVDRGVPVEYELVRSLCTVTEQKRKRVGVVESDAPLFGKFSMQGQSNEWRLITELKKQYEVVQVNPSQPIPLHKVAKNPDEKDEGFDVLLAVQPSSLGKPEMDNFIAAVKAGQPTVVFEDPFTWFLVRDVPANFPTRASPAARQPYDGHDAAAAFWKRVTSKHFGNSWALPFSAVQRTIDEFSPMPFEDDDDGRQGPDRLGKNYNPYPKLSDLEHEFIFIDHGCGSPEPFNEVDPIEHRSCNYCFLPAAGLYRYAQ